MKQSKLSTEDPRLTAYALGELDASEAAQVEEALRNDPSARDAVNDIRAMARELERALENEPIEPRVSTPAVLADVSESETRGQLLRFPSVWLTTAAAASVAAVLAFQALPNQKFANASAPADSESFANAKSPAPAGLEPAAVADDAARRRSMRDGFSDVKPATFREDGLKLGKSVASAETPDAAAAESADALDRNSETESDVVRFDSSEKAIAALNDVHSAVPAVTLNGDLPVLPINRATHVPVIQFNPDFTFASKDFKFNNSIAGSGVLKMTPRKAGTTYEQVLTWSHDASENQNKVPRRDDAVDPLKKSKHSATGAVVE
ncbi:MAG TPA: hypothetical protein VFT72_08735 [Opitutaceae bacterium]|nr:hypothetical protein [Opitutaceae bacterium]